MKKYKIGYTAGVYDLFHIGHLNLLKKAKEYCDYLIVAVSTDELVEENKKKKPIICFEERFQIINAIKYVDEVVPQTDYFDKVGAAKKYRINAMFVGDDWKNTTKWNNLEKELKKINVDVVYLPYTHTISSTLLRNKLEINS